MSARLRVLGIVLACMALLSVAWLIDLFCDWYQARVYGRAQ